jgi:hypothetical protein
MLEGDTFATEADARIEIFDFIESYYCVSAVSAGRFYLASASFRMASG